MERKRRQVLTNRIQQFCYGGFQSQRKNKEEGERELEVEEGEEEEDEKEEGKEMAKRFLED